MSNDMSKQSDNHNRRKEKVFIIDDEVNEDWIKKARKRIEAKLNPKKNNNISKLLTLETALEYLTKAVPGERLEYLAPNEKAPGDTKVHTTQRGARGYYPSEVTTGEKEETEALSTLEPEGEREITGVQAPKANPKPSSDYPKRIFDHATEQYLSVVVPDNPEVHGVEAGIHRLSQPHGAPVRGTPISIYDSRIPDTVYHMTTNAPAVRESKKLIAGGVGGLGGDDRDKIVSLTIDKEIAHQLAEDTKLASEIGRMGGGEYKSPERIKESRAIIKRLIQEMEKEGWDGPRFREYDDNHFEYLHESYNPKEWLSQYFSVRSGATSRLGKEKLNPLFFTDPETLAKINPENIDVIEIPKNALRTGAMITDFDLDNPYGLKEIRIYGDVGVSETITKNSDLSKLLTLETVLEYLVKAEVDEQREYLSGGRKAPEDTPVHTSKRGKKYYHPSEVGQLGRLEGPTKPHEIEIIQPPTPIEEVAPIEDGDEDDGDEDSGQRVKDGENYVFPDGMVDWKKFSKNFKKVSRDEVNKMIRQATLAGKGNGKLDGTQIQPKLIVLNKENKVSHISTADGHLVAINIYNPKEPKRGGKRRLHFAETADSKVQAMWIDGKDRLNSQYSFKWNASSEIANFEKMKKLAAAIPSIEKRIAADFKNPKPTEGVKRAETVKNASLAIALIHNTFRRVGGGKSDVVADGKDGRPKKIVGGKPAKVSVPTYGVTTFLNKHIKIKNNKVFLDFLGKKGVRNLVEVTNPLIAKELIKRKKVTEKDDKIIPISTTLVNKYLQDITKQPFTAKNFRTYHASRIAANIVDKIGKIPNLKRSDFEKHMYKQNKKVTGGLSEEDWKEEVFLWTIKEQERFKLDLVGEPTSKQMGNTKDVCVAEYIAPAVFQSWNTAFAAEVQEFMSVKPFRPKKMEQLKIKKREEDKKERAKKKVKKE